MSPIGKAAKTYGGARRVDGAPWGLVGLWNTWTRPSQRRVHESYTMLTLNADQHPLMQRMHKPDPKLPDDAQDKRSVLPIAAQDVDGVAGRHGGSGCCALLQLAPVGKCLMPGPVCAIVLPTICLRSSSPAAQVQ